MLSFIFVIFNCFSAQETLSRLWSTLRFHEFTDFPNQKKMFLNFSWNHRMIHKQSKIETEIDCSLQSQTLKVCHLLTVGAHLWTETVSAYFSAFWIHQMFSPICSQTFSNIFLSWNIWRRKKPSYWSKNFSSQFSSW